MPGKPLMLPVGEPDLAGVFKVERRIDRYAGLYSP